MTFEEFNKSLTSLSPPRSLPRLLEGLWWEKKGDWAAAHQIAQSIAGRDGALVHAFLHRREGDESNASYWYNRASRDKPHVSLEEEWESIVKELLNKS